MKNKTRWVISVATSLVALPASYGAALLLCGGPGSARGAVLAYALTLIP